jgi:N-dimethylarginine dimethylaminohydrolase
MLHADHRTWHYRDPIDPDRVTEEHRRFVEALRAHGVEVSTLDASGPPDPDAPPPRDDGLADSVFTYDPSFVGPTGAVLLRPGKALRRGETALHERFYAREGVPVIGRIEPPGTVEGGDLCWLDDTTLLAGRGFRTDRSGIDQLRAIFSAEGIDVVDFDLPYAHGPAACLHLMSILNPLDEDLALVHAPLLPVALHELLRARGYTLLDVPRGEFVTSGGLNLNVLATGRRRGIAIEGMPETHDLMRTAGCEITTFPGEALCINCEGGPTCLSRPLLRR